MTSTALKSLKGHFLTISADFLVEPPFAATSAFALCSLLFARSFNDSKIGNFHGINTINLQC